MQITGSFGPTNPYHLSRAYGVPARTAAPAPLAPANAPAQPFTLPTPPAAQPTATLQPAGAAARAEIVDRLSAGRVPGGVEFNQTGAAPGTQPFRPSQPAISPLAAARIAAYTASGPLAQPSPAAPLAGAFPMYRHPADRNEAATAVQMGRVLDVNG